MRLRWLRQRKLLLIVALLACGSLIVLNLYALSDVFSTNSSEGPNSLSDLRKSRRLGRVQPVSTSLDDPFSIERHDIVQTSESSAHEPKARDVLEMQRRVLALSPSREHRVKTLHDVPPANSDNIDMNLLYWQFVYRISQDHIYTEASHEKLDAMRNSLAHSPIADLYASSKGTQLKFFGQLADGTTVVLKPGRVPRNWETPPDRMYFVDMERHTSEIATYYLDRVLGFRRVPPCAGRLVNISSELVPFFNEETAVTVFKSPAGNTCFHGVCKYFCDTANAICGRGDVLELSTCLFVPYNTWTRGLVRHPWRRSYHKRRLADWETADTNRTYCSDLMRKEPKLYASGRRLLDLIDVAIVDFLIGNMDRHHYEFMQELDGDGGGDANLIMLDNGKGFGKTTHDEISILAPLYQCCRVRRSTYDKLELLDASPLGVHLSHLLRRALRGDPLDAREPLLTPGHLRALDRRVSIVLRAVQNDCIRQRGFSPKEVIVDDGL